MHEMHIKPTETYLDSFLTYKLFPEYRRLGWENFNLDTVGSEIDIQLNIYLKFKDI